MRLSKDKTQLKVNESLTLEKISPKVLNYRLGTAALSTGSSTSISGITSDPNNPDDEEYIVSSAKSSELASKLLKRSIRCHRTIQADNEHFEAGYARAALAV